MFSNLILLLRKGGISFNNMRERSFLFLYLGSIFCYTFILGLQGFEMHDEGLFLTAYQQLFEVPESAEFQFLWYNTVLIGALWNLLFGSAGILGFRFLATICITCIAFVVYLLLRKTINRFYIFLGIFIVLINNHYIITFHPNMMTALLCCISVFLLYNSLYRHSAKLFFITGVLIGINVFTRLPNATLCSLVLLLIPYAIYNNEIRKPIKFFMLVVSGFLTGFLFNLLLILILGHFETFHSSIVTCLNLSQVADSSHTLSSFIYIFFDDFRNVTKQIGIIISIPSLIILLFKVIKNYRLRISFSVALFIVYFYVIGKYHYEIASIYAFCCIILLLSVFIFRKNEKFIYLIVSSILVLIFLPIGSDYGLDTMGKNCVWISTPLSCGLLGKILHKTKNLHIQKIVYLSFIIFIFAFGSSNLYRTSLQCYFDNGNRLKKTERPNNYLATTYTSHSNCLKINELLEVLPKFISEKDFLLCWKSIPMLHYLTHTYPYLNNPWPETYDSESLISHFNRAQINHQKLPVIICNKSCTPIWDTFCEAWDTEDSNKSKYASRNKIFHNFVNKNSYKIIWENDLFQIMIPPTGD